MKKGKLCRNIAIILFLLLITALPLSWYLLPEETRSENSENRTLAEFPTVESPEDIPSLPAAFEDWYSDHLPYKEDMVELKSEAELSMFRQLDSDQVILGTKIPWLFYKAQDGQAIETYKRINQFTDESLQVIGDVLTGFSRDLSENGIGFLLMIVPDKETIYGPDYMPADIKVMKDRVHRTDQLIAYLEENAPEIRVLYPKEELLSGKDTAAAGISPEGENWPIYYESDTHWNRIGAGIGADSLLAALTEGSVGCMPPEKAVSFSDLGDGSSEAYPEGQPMKKKGDMQNLCKLPEVFDSREFRVEGLPQGSLVSQVMSPGGEAVYEVFRAKEPGGIGKLYIAGDSFRWNLRDFIQGEAEESVICSRYYLDTEDIKAKKPDTFVYMIAERYLHEFAGLPGVAAPALSYTEDFVRTDY